MIGLLGCARVTYSSELMSVFSGVLSKLEVGDNVFSDGDGGNGMRKGVFSSGRNRMCFPPLFLVPSRS